MHFYAGAPRWNEEQGKYVLDNEALENSMAQAIEDALEDVYEKVKGKTFPSAGKDDRRLLFVAIAQGVIKHLQENANDAFDVTVTVDQQTETGPWIKSSANTGTQFTNSGDPAGTHRHHVTVTQDTTQPDGSDNKVKSEGFGKVKILTE